MTNENNPTDQNDSGHDLDQSATVPAPARRTRARRVATSAVMTPASSPAPISTTDPASADDPGSAVDNSQGEPETGRSASVSAAPSAADASAEPTRAPRSRSRRATSASVAASAADHAPAAAEQSGIVEQPASAQEPAAAEKPATARRSRRATSPATPATAEARPETAAAAGPATAEDEPADAPKAKTARARGGRKAATTGTSTGAVEAPGIDPGTRDAPAPAAAPASARDHGSERPDATGTSSPARSGSLNVLAELGDRPAATPPARTGGESPRLATTALLFQAPDPASRPKRRRAQAPAGPPKPEDEVVTLADAVDDEELEGLVDESLASDEDSPDETSQNDADEDATSHDDSDEDDGDDGDEHGAQRRRRRRGGRGRRSRSGNGDRSEDDDQHTGHGDGAEQPDAEEHPSVPDADGDDHDAENDDADDTDDGESSGSSSRRRRRRRRGSRGDSAGSEESAASTGNGRSRSSRSSRTGSDEVTALKGSTRLEAKRQRRREGRDAGRRRTIVTESEFLARREAVERSMIVREANGRVQIAVLEDGVLVEHFVSRSAQNGQSSTAGNVYLGRVQNVLPSMEAAFVDVGKGRNAVLYAGEVNWDAAGMEGQPRRIEQALKSGDSVLVQVTKDPIGHKGARLTSQITLAGRYLVYVPGGGMTGISRKLPENERARLKKILKDVVPDAAGVIVRTAAEGASEEELRNDVARLQDQWAAIEKKAKTASAPALLQGEPDLAIRVVRDIFNDDFGSLLVQGDEAWSMISEYVDVMAPDLAAKVSRWEQDVDVFAEHRIDEQLAKGMDRKVWLPSGGSLVIDRTEAMTVVDVNTGKFTGSGGTLEETVTRNNLEAAEEIVRQLRLRDIGGIIVIDFIDMVLESNRDLVLRRLLECLGRDRTKHQVAEVTSLGLVQMTRKRVGQGLVEAFSETCQHCNGRGFIVHSEPIDGKGASEQDGGRPVSASDGGAESKRSRRKKATAPAVAPVTVPVLPEAREAVKATLATIAAAAAHAHEQGLGAVAADEDGQVPDVAAEVEPAVGNEPVTPDDQS